MLKNKLYTCEICKTKADQLSHHKSHLETQKHKYKKELFELKLTKLSIEELERMHNTTDIDIIIDENETNIYVPVEDNNLVIHDKKTQNNEIFFEEDNNNVSNKEALKDKIHEIHNFLRNNGAGYGMNALKVFNLLYGLKKIEEKQLLDKVNLKRPTCEFSYLLKIANENKDETLAEIIFGNDKDKIDDNVLSLVKKSDIGELLFYEFPHNMKSSSFAYLIKEIDKITKIEETCNVLLSGKIYEYFIGRDESAISELGAYFTDRHIVDYIYKKLNSNINEDNSIKTMIDMFGGSGGFTTGYINYLQNKYPNKIKWKKEINNIYHYDMNEDVIKSAGLEFFCLTGVLPNMNNLGYRNSFTDEFNNKKFMNVVTNPPYGGDKISQSDAQIKRTKIKDYIKKELETLPKNDLKIKIRLRQLKNIEKQQKQEKKDNDKTKVSVEMSSQRIQKFAKNNNLNGNDKESTSLMLIMDMVDVNGTAIGVLKEGVLTNKIYKDLRKCLVTNYNVREIISVPQDQFENTKTKTSIVIFDNTIQKTSKIKFYELVVEKYSEDKFIEINNNIVLIENKNDISSICDKLISEATIDEILNNPIISLNSKYYNKKKIIVNNDYDLVKIEDLCDFLQNSQRNASFGKKEGKYNFYTSSDRVQKCDIVDYEQDCILIGKGGNSCIHYDNNFSCSADILLLTSDKINQKYIFFAIKSLWNLLIDSMYGSTIKHVTKDMLKNFTIPIPKSNQKIIEWVDNISEVYDLKNETQKQITKLDLEIKEKINNIISTKDCEEIELKNIFNFVSGKFNSSDCKETGLYPFYNGKAIQPDGYSDKFCYDSTEYIIIIKDGGAGIRKYGDQIGLGNVFLVNGKSGFTSHQLALEPKTNTINIKYILYVLKINKNNIMDLANYSTALGTINKTDLGNFKIKIPTNLKILDSLDVLFTNLQKLQMEFKEADIKFKKLIAKLADDAIAKNFSNVQIDNSDEFEENIINKKVIKITSKKVNKSKKLQNNIL